jgi:hypothetical protein
MRTDRFGSRGQPREHNLQPQLLRMASLGAADQGVVGMVGRVTGLVAPGAVGEVTLPIRGGSQAFHAYPSDGEEILAPGTRIVVVEYEPPRTVTVARLTY